MARPALLTRIRKFCVRVIGLVRVLERMPGGGRDLARQLFRSATSIHANLAEANASQSRKDFIHKVSLASKEAQETRAWLKLILDADYFAPDRLKPLHQESDEIARILFTIVKNTRNSS